MSLTPSTCRSIYDKHERYWEDRRPELRRLRNAYQMRFWVRTNYDPRQELLVETSRAYELVESYVASLFMRDPAVVVRGDLRGRGDQDKAQALANDWLTHVRRQMEDALRLAIIYPWAALKVAPRSHPDPLQRVTVAALPPWDVLVDDTARAWDYQRYVGVRVMMPVEEARERYGRKQWATRTFRQFLDRNGDEDAPSYGPDDEDAIGEFVEVVEFYDLTGDRFLVWSPDYANGSKWVADGVELEVGVEDPVSEKVDSIPVRTADDYPLVPVVPLYLSREPDRPLRGYSGLRRVYDQVQESNTIRTYQANGVRRAARQWLVQKGTLDAESMAKMVMGQDGEFIEVETSPGQQLAGAIVPVPHLPVPAELQTYLNQVDEDFARGSILAPFTRGEATKATATEVTAMAAYSSSEVGRMARERDAAIAQLAEVYVAMVRLSLGDEPEVVRLNGRAQAIRADDLDGDFTFYAQDSGATPVSEAVRKSELIGAVPQLLELGVPRELVLSELVRALDLPESFLPGEAAAGVEDETPAPPPVATAAPPQAGPPMGAEQVPATMGLGIGPGELPSPTQIQAVLPPGGIV